MQLFYAPDILGENIVLDEEEAKHCIRVLRMKMGDKVEVTDGKGNIFSVEIISDNPQKCLLKVLQKQVLSKKNYHIHIAIAPPKSMSRFEWFLEKVTELGIDEITPLLCERSERVRLNMERLNKILIESMKQSLQAYLPKLNSPVKISEFITGQTAISSLTRTFIAHCSATSNNHLKSSYTKGESAIILIGPEGDFSEKEVELAHQNNFPSISLGNTRLRTETAGIVACQTIHVLNT